MKSIYRIFIFIIALCFVSCRTSPNSEEKAPTTKDVTSDIVQTIKVKNFDKKELQAQINKFSKIVKSRKKLSADDLLLHDLLLEAYKSLKYRPIDNKLIIPAHTKLIVPFNSYCLDSGKANPSAKEVYVWSKQKNTITYLPELLKLSTENKYSQELIQEIIWNIQNKTYWENYPSKHQKILETIDHRASEKIPSESTEKVKSIFKETIFDTLPSEAKDQIDQIQGQFRNFENTKSQLENQTSNLKPPASDISKVDGFSNLYTSNNSQSFSQQDVTFYNNSAIPILVNLAEYTQIPARADVQRLAAYFSEDPELVKIFNELEKLLYSDMAQYGYGFVPVLNDLIDLYEVTSGKNFFTNEILSNQERFLSALGLLLGNAEAYRQASKIFNGPGYYIDDAFKKYRHIKNEKSYKTLEKLADDLKNKGMPDDWGVKVTKGGKKADQGLVYTHPYNSDKDIRIMPGNPNSPHTNSHKANVRVKNGSTFYDKNGVKVKEKSSESHIPLEEFNFEVFKDLFK